jgi:hypothetical protein
METSDYQDDRSSAESLIQSYYNAVNMKQYSRAYSYFESPPPSFDSFAQGYADTASVQVITGDATGEGAAGSTYFRLPVTLIATMNDGSTQTFVGCYTARLVNPMIQTQPPFQPLSIYDANIQQVDNSADTAALMATACQQ